ncbi:hypothetical protein DFH06DRAFT_1470000 [Mycena polygramma]|nr:hypothetical protein DFH06DRAFT_1470000 [Mycena polygramma]
MSSSEAWPQILQVPLEIWLQVSDLSGRQSIARLCGVSHDFHSIFAVILYRNMTTDPPLPWKRTKLLVRTLREAPTLLTSKLPLGEVIRSLCLPGKGYPDILLSHCLEALRNLVEISPLAGLSDRPLRGAALRDLKWDWENGSNELATLLLMPGYFPNLKELSVRSTAEKNSSCYKFMQVRDLEKLECILSLSGQRYAEWQPSWAVFRHSLGALQMSSPTLHTLILKIDLHIYLLMESDYAQVYNVDTDLILAINEMRFPALTEFQFLLHTSGFRLRDPAMDFSPFLQGHPLLANVTLNVEGVCVPPGADASFLPHLVSFRGAARNCAAMLAHARGLRSITILFPSGYDEDPQRTLQGNTPVPFTSALFRPRSSPGVTSLDARAVNLSGSTVHCYCLLCPEALTCLIAAFPNLTHLDISLSRPLDQYLASLTALVRLQHLGVRSTEHINWADLNRTAVDLFPPGRYADQIDVLLPLAQLSDIRIIIWADRSEAMNRCGACSSCCMEPMPDLFIEYRFGRGLGDEFQLVESTTMNDRGHKSWETSLSTAEGRKLWSL